MQRTRSSSSWRLAALKTRRCLSRSRSPEARGPITQSHGSRTAPTSCPSSTRERRGPSGTRSRRSLRSRTFPPRCARRRVTASSGKSSAPVPSRKTTRRNWGRSSPRARCRRTTPRRWQMHTRGVQSCSRRPRWRRSAAVGMRPARKRRSSPSPWRTHTARHSSRSRCRARSGKMRPPVSRKTRSSRCWVLWENPPTRLLFRLATVRWRAGMTCQASRRRWTGACLTRRLIRWRTRRAGAPGAASQIRRG